jgi:hypothetical protein
MVDLEMRRLVTVIETITVTPGAFSFNDSGPSTRPTMSREEIESVPQIDVEGLAHPSDPDELWRAAVRANVRASADHLRHGSRILEELVLKGDLRVVGAEYEIETGIVSFFDGVPLAPPEGAPSRPVHALT